MSPSQPNTGATAPRWIRRRGLLLAGSAAGSTPTPQVGAVLPWIHAAAVWIHVAGVGSRRGRPGSMHPPWIHYCVDPRRRESTRPPGSAAVWITHPCGPRSSSPTRERDEGGTERREREREIPGTAALSSPNPVTVLDPCGGARDGEVVARATLLNVALRRGLHTPAARATSLVPAPQRGLHTPAREREREWERPSRWRRRECVRRGSSWSGGARRGSRGGRGGSGAWG